MRGVGCKICKEFIRYGTYRVSGNVAVVESVYRVVQSKPGVITLSDGTKLVLRVVIVGVKHTGFSPFDRVNFAVKTAGGVASLYVPSELKEKVKDRPLSPPDGLPREGWELIDIQSQEPAMEEVEVEVEGKRYRVRVVGEASMVARNTSYRTDMGEPLYFVHWSIKIQWRSVG